MSFNQTKGAKLASNGWCPSVRPDIVYAHLKS